MAPASQTIARTYEAMIEGSSRPGAPGIIDELPPIGNPRTHSNNNLVTDSAAAGTGLATGHKTNNGAIGILPDNQPVGSILEAAKLNGYRTALVVTSIINHATPAAFSSHVVNRNGLAAIAEQQIGCSHPLNQSNRSAFDDLDKGLGDIRLRYVGLFSDGDLNYEIDRQQQPEADREPSLAEMTTAALSSLHRASHCKDKGYFIMIEASRIDHASHAYDSVAHLWDVLEYNNVVNVVTKWIDEHPDTAMLSVADHETGGLTFPSGYDPRPLAAAKHSIAYLTELWNDYNGNDRRGFLRNEILPAYGVNDATDAEVEALLAGDFAANLAKPMNKRTGHAWSTCGHSAVDTTLYAYGAEDMGDQLIIDMAGAHNNTELPKYIAKALKVSLEEVTELLRANGTDWIPRV
ncbi:hypothetical protein VdG2_06848 [Verticillium dahliae VDG2]|nr:hypothetical protein VdG2_06848 [Verticillium dahliae VDG2]